ncbi:MAG TPA: outer membrane beta-barrel protein, partial [Gemmatimonadales bacterium]|nr:outer membrane beta-barrel protein [Gemmatimonadales bacterium]
MPRPRPAALWVALLAALALARPVEAQRSPKAVGFQAGYADAGLSVEGLDDGLESRAGAYVGVYFRARLLPWLALQPEVDFTIKGGEIPTGGLLPVDLVRLDLGVLELPLLVRISTPYRRESIRPVVFGGASIGFEIGCSRTLVTQSQVRSVECDRSGTVTVGEGSIEVEPLEVRSPDVSWVLGGGVQ